jgi:hypothetical protein
MGGSLRLQLFESDSCQKYWPEIDKFDAVSDSHQIALIARKQGAHRALTSGSVSLSNSLFNAFLMLAYGPCSGFYSIFSWCP